MSRPKYKCPSGHSLVKSSAEGVYVCLACGATYPTEAIENGINPHRSAAKNPNKMGAQRVQIDGIWFDSKFEGEYYCGLKLLLRAGEIKAFFRQPRFLLQEAHGKNNPVEYVADFGVIENDGSCRIVDTKGFETQSFKIKKKLLEARYDITLETVRKQPA